MPKLCKSSLSMTLREDLSSSMLYDQHLSNHLVPEIKFCSCAWRDRKVICQAWYDHLMNDIMICLEGRMMRLGPQAFPLNILSGGCVGVSSLGL